MSTQPNELRKLAGLIIYGDDFAIGHDYDEGEADIERAINLIHSNRTALLSTIDGLIGEKQIIATRQFVQIGKDHEVKVVTDEFYQYKSGFNKAIDEFRQAITSLKGQRGSDNG